VSMQQNNQKFGDLNVAGGSVNGGFLDPRTVTGVTSMATNSGLPGGFSYFGKLNQDFDFAVTATANDNRINVLSRPRIQTSTAKAAHIFVGETRPYVTGSYFSDFGGGGSRSQYSQLQIGINLDVMPIINQEGLVVMEIQQHISQVSPNGVSIDGNEVPITIDRDANSYVAVHDRDTILLGGFISTTKGKRTDGVPYLKDIPYLGALFRSSSDSIQRVELMVLIRPTVLPTPEAAALEAAAQRDMSPEIKRAERDEQEFFRKQMEKERKAEEKFERRTR
jgi:general secretion pathway protein D